MSPEQVRGEEAGPASDIFAFGCVLCEMLTGSRPFARATTAETMSAILRDGPPRLGDHVGDVPREEEGRGSRLYVQPIAGGEPAAITSEGIGLGTLAVSPDGTIVVANWKDGKPWLFPLAGGEPRPLPGGLPGELTARWATDGKRVCQYRLGVELVLRLVDVRDGTSETFRTLRPSDPAGVTWIALVVLAADGNSHGYTCFRVLSGLYVVGGLR